MEKTTWFYSYLAQDSGTFLYSFIINLEGQKNTSQALLSRLFAGTEARVAFRNKMNDGK